MKFLLIHLI